LDAELLGNIAYIAGVSQRYLSEDLRNEGKVRPKISQAQLV
jgi:hypothetical protein